MTIEEKAWNNVNNRWSNRLSRLAYKVVVPVGMLFGIELMISALSAGAAVYTLVIGSLGGLGWKVDTAEKACHENPELFDERIEKAKGFNKMLLLKVKSVYYEEMAEEIAKLKEQGYIDEDSRGLVATPVMNIEDDKSVGDTKDKSLNEGNSFRLVNNAFVKYLRRLAIRFSLSAASGLISGGLFGFNFIASNSYVAIPALCVLATAIQSGLETWNEVKYVVGNTEKIDKDIAEANGGKKKRLIALKERINRNLNAEIERLKKKECVEEKPVVEVPYLYSNQIRMMDIKGRESVGVRKFIENRRKKLQSKFSALVVNLDKKVFWRKR